MTQDEAIVALKSEMEYLTSRIAGLDTTIFQMECEQREMQERLKFLKLKFKDLSKKVH